MHAEVDIVAAPVHSDGFRTFISAKDQATPTEGATKQETARATDFETISITMASGEYLARTHFRVATPKEILEHIFFPDKFDDYSAPLPSINLSSRDITRWKMAWRAIQAFKFESDRGPTVSICHATKSRCKDWPDAEDVLNSFSVALGFSAAALMYGGLHALAWFAHFDSSTQQLLWRILVCVVIGGVPVMYALTKIDDHLFLIFEISRFSYWTSLITVGI